ncbi:hypothetical protein BH23VER1_BH23VER1_28360 [soil metagenome]
MLISLQFRKSHELKMALIRLESKVTEIVESRFFSSLEPQDKLVIKELIEGLILRSFMPRDEFGEKVLETVKQGNLVGKIDEINEPVVW